MTGGRAYVGARPVDVPTIYDDLMESLRFPYVVTYSAPGSRPRRSRAGEGFRSNWSMAGSMLP